MESQARDKLNFGRLFVVVVAVFVVVVVSTFGCRCLQVTQPFHIYVYKYIQSYKLYLFSPKQTL